VTSSIGSKWSPDVPSQPEQWKKRPFNDDAITIGGQLFYETVSEEMHKLKMPPIGATLEQKRPYEEKFNKRANHTAPVCTQSPRDGTTRWQNPFEVGSLRSEQHPCR
jgi:hypothetical protein